MNKNELMNVMDYIGMAYGPAKFGYPTESDEMNKMKARTWYDLIGHLDFGMVMKAVKMYCNKGAQWPPSPGEILGMVEQLNTEQKGVMSGPEAYRAAIGAVQKFGSYRMEDAKKSLSPEVWAAIECTGGYMTLCMSQEGDTFLMNRFLNVYDEVKERERFRRNAQQLESRCTGNLLGNGSEKRE